MRFDVLYNFISPVSGRILSNPDYVPLGDTSGIATPSPVIIDIRLDLINLRQEINIIEQTSFVIGSPNTKLPYAQVLNTLDDGYMVNTGGMVSTTGSIPPASLELPEGYVFVGNSSNKAAAFPTIQQGNLPDLPFHCIWVGNLFGRPEITAYTGSGAPTDAKYILQQSNGDLPNAQALKDLFFLPTSSGILKASGYDGAISLAVADGDYATPGSVADAITTAGAYTDAVAVTTFTSAVSVAVTTSALYTDGVAATTLASAAAAAVAYTNSAISLLKLNNISADGDVSIHGHKLIDVADPINPQDVVTLNYLNEIIPGIPTSIDLIGDVTGTGSTGSPIRTTVAICPPSAITGYPGDSSTFLRGDGTWTNILTANLSINGNIGIGTTSASTPLNIVSGVSGSISSQITLQSPRSFGPATDGLKIIATPNNGTLGTHDYGTIILGSNPAVSDGGAAIAEFRIGGSSSFSPGGRYLYVNSLYSGGVQSVSIWAGSPSTQVGTFYNGCFGVNDSTPASTLSIVGNAQIGFSSSTTSASNGLVVSGNVGIGTTSPNSPLQFPSTVNNRIITLYEAANNSYQYFGFGISTGTLIYQVDSTSSNHVFYAGTSSTTSSILATIKGTGGIDVAGYNITNLATPIVSTDAANKGYVDSAVGGVPASITLIGDVTGSGSTGSSTITTTVAICPPSAIIGYPSNTSTFLRGDGTWTNVLSGSLGLEGTTPHVPLQFSNTLENRKIVLLETANNDNQVFGFGTATNILIYQVDSTGSSHIFYAGTSSTTSMILAKIKGTGGLDNASFKITSVGPPSISTDAANKGYVDSAIGGIPTTIDLIGDVTGTGSTGLPIKTTVAICAPSAITGYPSNTSTFLRGDGTWTNILSGNLALGGAATNSSLQFPSTVNKRIITLYETVNNINQYFGFGTTAGALVYQVDSTSSNHVFYAGTSSTTSTELFRITGTGYVGIGNSNPTAPLQFADGSANRKIVLNTGVGGAINDHQFFGFGYNANVLRYQVDNVVGSGAHVFYVGDGSSTSIELMRIAATSNYNGAYVGIGNSSPTCPLEFTNTDNARIITLRSNAENTYQYWGFGVVNNCLNYHIDNTSVGAHVFYVGASSTSANELFRIAGSGNVSINGAVTNSPLQFPNTINNRIITLYEAANNSYQYFGFGTASGTLVYQVDATTSNHVFYAGTSSTTSSILATIKGTGGIDVAGYNITSLATPTISTHAANKGYVDSAVGGVPASITLIGDVTGNGSTGSSTITTTVAICPPSAIIGYPSNTSTFLRGDGTWTNMLSGNLALGGADANSLLQFPNSMNRRIITLYESYDNMYQYYGFGVDNNTLVYQVDSTSSDHVFYAAVPAYTNELFRITGTDYLGIDNSNPTASLQFASFELFRIAGSGNVSISGASANSPLQFPSTVNNRIITLYEAANNSYQYFGFGTASGTLVYQVDATTSNHVFYAGTSSTTSSILATIKGTGGIDVAGYNITSLATPTISTHAANKGYVDSAVGGVPASITLIGDVTGSGSTGSSTITTTVAICPPSAIIGYPSNTSTFLRGDGTWTNMLSGNLALGGAATNSLLQFPSTVNKRIITLYETVNNINQYYGFGTAPGTLIYQVDSTSSNHVFYAGTSSTASTELFRIAGSGNISINGAIANSALQFPSTVNKRIITLCETANNTNQYFGFGTAAGTLVYQVDSTNSNHVFYAGTSGSTSSVLATIKGTGGVDVAGYNITSLATPTISTHAANKGYVDSAISGVPGNITLIGNVTGTGSPGSSSINTTVAICPPSAITGYPGNTSTFLRGDGSWTNILTANLSINGNIGIGTTSASTPLNIVSGVAGSISSQITLQSPRSFGPATDGLKIIATPNNGTLGTHDYGTIILGSNPAVSDGGAAIAEFRIGGSSSFSPGGRYLYVNSLYSGGVQSVSIWAGSPSTQVGTFYNGCFGVNDSTPASTLSIVGNAQIGFSSSTTSASNGLVVSGNVGIGTTSPNSPLQFPSTVNKRIITLYETANNINQYFGFGTAAGTLVYQVGSTSSNHVFYAGASSTTSNELFRITGTGNIIVQGNTSIGRTKGTIGASLLELYGTDGSTTGPHIQCITSADNYPLLQILPYTHNNVTINFDSYYDGTWRSAYSGSNYQISKFSNQLQFNYASGVGQGSPISWATSMYINTNGDIVTNGTTYGSKPYGNIYVYNSTTSTYLLNGSWTKLAGTTNIGSTNHFTSPSSNRLTYGGTISINSLVIANVSISNTVTAGTNMGIAIFKNGALIGAGAFTASTAANQLQNLSISSYISFSTNDYVEIWVQTAYTGGCYINLVHLSLSAISL